MDSGKMDRLRIEVKQSLEFMITMIDEGVINDSTGMDSTYDFDEFKIDIQIEVKG